MKKPKLQIKEDYVFLVDFRPKSKKDCDNLIESIKICKKFIKEVRYSKPEQNEAIKRKTNKK